MRMGSTWNPGAAAARGAVWADENVPHWAEIVSASALNMGDCDECVGGQLEGDYHLFQDRMNLTPQQCVDLGFNVTFDVLNASTDEEKDEAFADLTAAWREEIVKRRFAAVPA